LVNTLRVTGGYARFIGMTYPGGWGQNPQPQDVPPGGAYEPPPIEQTRGQPTFDAAPSPSYPPPGYPPPPPPGYPAPGGAVDGAYGQPQYSQPGSVPGAQYPPPSYPPPPYTGTAYSGYSGYPEAQQQPTNRLAIWSLVLSLVGIPLGFFIIGDLALIAGVVTGIMALAQIKRTNQQGSGLAIAAIAIGAVALFLGIFYDIGFFSQMMKGDSS
jgi:hypothetical protein